MVEDSFGKCSTVNAKRLAAGSVTGLRCVSDLLHFDHAAAAAAAAQVCSLALSTTGRAPFAD